MKRKIVAVWVSLTMVLGLIVIVDVTMDFTINAGGATLYVNKTGSGGAYTSIQDAINAANPGDTVFVYNGTYYESITIDKTINLRGENADGAYIFVVSGHGILITSNNVHVSRMKVNYATDTGKAAIRLEDVQNCRINENKVSSSYYGIYLDYSDHNTITNNVVKLNHHEGIYLDYSNNNFLAGNTCDDNNDHGIRLGSSYNNTITNNLVKDNGESGITLSISYNNTISNNNITSNTMDGIVLHVASENLVINNLITMCGWPSDGIHLYMASNNVLMKNKIILNDYNGIGIISSSINNIIFANNISLNDNHGMDIGNDANYNLIYHNNFDDNRYPAEDDGVGNRWNSTYPTGGNYWSDYTGSDIYNGPNQNIPGSDGIGDTPFVDITGYGNAQDNYPLMMPHDIYNDSIILKEGWNLISIPLLQADQIPTKVLEKIEGYYDAVQWYDVKDETDPWKHMILGKPFGNDLDLLNESMSFWIHITQPGDTIFMYNGTEPTSNQTIRLYEGWNMVGYPSLSDHNRTVGLNNLEFGVDVDCIQWYEAGSKSWHFMEQDDYFVPGRGYWVHSKVEASWEVSI